jgi:FKBP-type peptidyl-prolyl cis-trans isomerase SlpA
VNIPKENDTVVIAFTGKLDNGEAFFIVDQKKPLEVVLGNSDLPPTLENVLLTMQVGEMQKVRVPPEEGYGPRQKNLLQTIDNKDMVESLKPKPGMVLSLKVDKEGTEQEVPATVMEVDGDNITVDYNHPLAGHHLTYEVILLEIKTPAVQ